MSGAKVKGHITGLSASINIIHRKSLKKNSSLLKFPLVQVLFQEAMITSKTTTL
jgi:hypothetical protein